MLTITTTARIDRLRQRAEEAETALGDTARQLGTEQEERAARDLELQAVRADLNAALDASGQTLAKEAMASAARARSACDVVVKGASAQLAARDRTIAELRAELEQVRARPSTAAPEHTVLTFLTALGGLVALIGKPATEYSDREFTWRCLACGDRSFDADSFGERSRRLANAHAGQCRAVPGVRTTALG
ncbi:hypothetical protein ACFWXO_05305 [Kitasatospora sp. NPDC059088]|uniref:hypothetical protein n=1 Tax=Kitasatospora sp. NPDC059088 TaxID=3346722 RepID=UPI0036B200E8